MKGVEDLREEGKAYWNVQISPGGSRLPGEDVTIEVINDSIGMATLAPEWNDLLSGSSATVFQSFEWQWFWWRHFGAEAGHQLYLIVFRSGGKVVGIAPFFLQTTSLFHFKAFRRLLLLGSGLGSPRSPLLSMERQGPSDYLDIIVARGFEGQICRSLLALLRHEGYLWDEIELQNVPEQGILFTRFLPLVEQSGFSVAKNVEDICPYVQLPKSLEECLLSLRRSVRRNLRYSQKQYLDRDGFTIEDIGGGGNIEGGLQVLSHLHQKQWNAAGYPGLFADRRFGPFLRESAESLRRRGRLWFKLLRHDGKAIAASLGFTFNRRFHMYISGFDRKGAGTSTTSGAGAALRLLTISDSIRSGIEVFDMGRGEEAYKFQLTSLVARNWRIAVTAPGRAGPVARRRALRVVARWNRMVSRVWCEVSILTVIARERGPVRAPGAYLRHLLRRVARRGGEHGGLQLAGEESGEPSDAQELIRRDG